MCIDNGELSEMKKACYVQWTVKDWEGSSHGLFHSTIPAFTWRDLETPEELRIASAASLILNQLSAIRYGLLCY